jgi:hypothetical protein
VRLAGLAVGRADERDARATLGQVRQHAAMKDLVVGMSEGDEK